VDAPDGYRKWRFHWFACPSCCHRSFSTHAKVSAVADPARLLWRFWCEQCGAYSTLKLPYLNAVLALLVLGPTMFFVLYNVLSGSLFNLSFAWALVFCIAFAAASPLLGCAFTRLTNRYVSIARVEP
jgi:hypothetical protein